MKYCVDFADVRKELVAESFALRCTFDESRYIDEFDRRGGVFFGMVYFRKRVKALVGHGNDTDVRVDGAESVVCRLRACLCERVEKRTFAYVGESDDTEFHVFFPSSELLYYNTILYHKARRLQYETLIHLLRH